MKPTPVLSEGMGVESSTILTRWIKEPETRILPSGEPFDLTDLVVVTSMVGSEYPDTQQLMETHLLPLMREHRIRYVQVAKRAAKREKGVPGYVVLDDSRCPERLHFDGAYTLQQQMLDTAALPLTTGTRLCSLHFKAEVIEEWMQDHFYGPICHAFGYNREELTRVIDSEAGIYTRNRAAAHRIYMAFGFNSNERTRIAEGSRYDWPLRIGWYPLLEWGWDRAKCHEYLTSVFGVRWKKSACVFCPFNRMKGPAIARHKRYPELVAEALLMEHQALAVNPRSALYKTKSLFDVSTKNGNTEALLAFERRVAALPWAVYRVRRLFTKGKKVDANGKPKRGPVLRSLQSVFRGSAADAAAQLDELTADLGLHVEETARHRYAWRSRKCADVLPTAEELYVVAPALASDKQVPRFEREWESFETGAAPHEDGVLPLFDYCGANDFAVGSCDDLAA